MTHHLPVSGFKVLAPGMLTLFQDLGRFGKANLGLTTSGPADKRAFEWANRLLENEENAPALEITIGGVTLEAMTHTSICLTGAKLALKVNGIELDGWRTHKVKPGDHIEIGYAEQGTRAYFAVKAGFQLEQEFGSCATTLREGIGGHNGNKVQAGDTLFVLATKPLTQARYLSEHLRPEYASDIVIRVVTGYQQKDFSRLQQQRFFSSDYRVSKQWDRMGYRLEGPKIQTEAKPMLSEGITLGAIQIPPDGQPIVLMHDRQTIGGYPKIGSVFSLDLARLAQCSQGAKVRFEAITIEQAHNALHLDQYRYKNTKVEQSPW